MELVPVDDGVRLATWTTGTRGSYPPVVLLHGGPGLWDYLQPLALMLDDITLVHRYDHRGCGRSDSAGPLSMARYVADVDALRRHWGHERWTLIGHSFGATLALAYAASLPERGAAVGYLCGVGIGDWREPFRAEKRRRARPHQARLDELAARPRSRDEEIEWRVLTWSTDYADTDRGRDYARPMAQQPWPINLAANRDVTFTDSDCLAWARALRCPITFVHGAADPRPAANALLLADRVPGSARHVLESAGHLPWFEQPRRVADLLREVVTTAAG
jgi:proline iminopeptidase